MESLQQPRFSAQPQVISCAALLFDFDGTIIDSTAAIVKNWQKLADEMGVDPEVILATSHGRRSIDTLRMYDPARANYEYISAMEGRIPRDFGDDAVEIPGARQLLDDLDSLCAPWAIVISGTRAVITGWQDVLDLVEPKVMVVAEDVDNGKPDPACYLLGRSRLGLGEETNLIVVEDAPAGVQAGKAAGFRVIGLVTTHSAEQIRDAGADWIVRDLQSVSAKTYKAEKIELLLQNAMVD